MTEINLLPWRIKHKKTRNRIFYSVLGLCVGITCLCVILIHVILLGLQRRESANIAYLEFELKKIDQDLKEIIHLKSEKEELIQSMQVIYTLQHERFNLVRLLDTMVHVIPRGLTLTEFNRKEDHIHLQGIADTNASISELLRNLSQIKEIVNLKLTEVCCHKKQVGLHFKMEFDEAGKMKS